MVYSNICKEAVVMVRSTKRKTTKQFKQEVYDLVGDEYTVLGEYKNSKTKVLMKHNKCNTEWKVVPNNFLRGTRCPNCEPNHHEKKTYNQVLKEIKEQVGNHYTLLSNTYVNADSKLTFRHNDCGNVFKMSAYLFLIVGQRCPACRYKRSGRAHNLKSKLEFEDRVKKEGGGEYQVLDSYVDSYTQVRMKHIPCGKIYSVAPYKFFSGRRCPYCISSNGESIIYQILVNDFNLEPEKDFYHGYVLPNGLHLDFWLPKFNTAIEYDGRQHFMAIDYFGGEESFKKQQDRDRKKDLYCVNEGINLIRIPYTDYKYDTIKADLIKLEGHKEAMTKIDQEQIEFKKVNSLDLHELMVKYHYLHRVVACKYAYGMYYQNQLVGMVTYTHVRKSLASSISPLANKDNTLELSRLYIKDEVSQNLKNITSKFVSWTLRQLKKEQDGNWFIISFADQGMHHTGAIYQATNFLYCGTTDSGIFCYNGPDKKGGKWVKGHHYRFFILRSIKYRYIMFLGSKTFKKKARKTLKFDIEPYPKQDSIHYSVGDIEERLIRDRQENKVYTETELLKAFPNYDWNGDNGEVVKPIKPKITKKVNKHFAPVYAISTKTLQVFQFESIRSCAETLGVGERNIKHCLEDKKGSLGGFVFCRPDDYTLEIAKKLVEKAKKSTKYNHDFIVDGNWVEGMTKVRKIVGASRSSIHKAIDVNRREVKGHTIDIPSPKDIVKHYKSAYQPLATYLIS